MAIDTKLSYKVIKEIDSQSVVIHLGDTDTTRIEVAQFEEVQKNGPTNGATGIVVDIPLGHVFIESDFMEAALNKLQDARLG